MRLYLAEQVDQDPQLEWYSQLLRKNFHFQKEIVYSNEEKKKGEKFFQISISFVFSLFDIFEFYKL